MAVGGARRGRSPGLVLVGPALLIVVVGLAVLGRGRESGAAGATPAPADGGRAVAAVEVAASGAPETSASPETSAASGPRPSLGLRSDWPAAIAAAQRPASDGYVNRFTIDDAVARGAPLDTTPPWVRRVGTGRQAIAVVRAEP